MRKLLLLTFIISSLSGYTQQKIRNNFKLLGIIKHPQTDYLYLRYTNSNGIPVFDSAAIINGQFEFRGEITEPTKAIFKANKKFIPDDQNLNIAQIYLEPTTMEVEVTYNEFSKAVFRGSMTQNETRVLKKYTDTILPNSPSTFQSYSNATKAFMRDHPASFVSLSNLQAYANHWLIDTVITLYNLLSDVYKETKAGKELSSFINKKRETSVGAMARGFTTQDINGNSINLSDFKNRYVLIDFWGSWCVPCREGMPHLKKIYDKYKNKGLSILAVAHEREPFDKAWKEAISKDGTSMFLHVRAELKNDVTYKSISEKYFVTLFPTKFLIDPSGKIIGKYLGTDDDSKLDQKLEEIFR